MAYKKKITYKRRLKKKSRFHSGIYKGMALDSSWELAAVVYWQAHGKEVIRNTEKFPYTYRQKNYRWIPDFIVDGNFIEIKGRETQRTFAKYKCFKHPLIIMRRKDLKAIFTYVVKKYGKEFWKVLYE